MENWEVDEISPEISGLEFFDNFVKERKPVKFNQIFSEFDREQWNFENLKKIAGDEKVCVTFLAMFSFRVWRVGINPEMQKMPRKKFSKVPPESPEIQTAFRF